MIRSPGRRNSKLIGALYWGQGEAARAHLRQSKVTRGRTAGSEPLGVVTITILPIHSLRCATKLFYGTRGTHSNRPIQHVNMKFLSRCKLEAFTDFLGDNNLKFGRKLDCVHYRSSYSTSSV